jgi:hypothetical protein
MADSVFGVRTCELILFLLVILDFPSRFKLRPFGPGEFGGPSEREMGACKFLPNACD